MTYAKHFAFSVPKWFRRIMEVVLQLGNIIVIAACVGALLWAHYGAINVVQITKFSETPSVSSITVTVTETAMGQTTSNTCTSGHSGICTFSPSLTDNINVNADLSGAVFHTTTMLNPTALSAYEWWSDLGWGFAILGLILCVVNFYVWLRRRRRSVTTEPQENALAREIRS